MSFGLENVVQLMAGMFIVMMLGFVVITGWILSELTYIKYAIAQVLAANPKIAEEVAKFTKKRKENIEEIKEDKNE